MNKQIREVDGVLIVPAGYSRPVFQGDMCLRRVDSIPKDAKRSKDSIVAHSETGHHHVAEKAIVFTTGDAMRLFFKAIGRDPVSIVHKREHDTHKTVQIPPGEVWEVRRQREWVPEGWRMVQD